MNIKSIFEMFFRKNEKTKNNDFVNGSIAFIDGDQPITQILKSYAYHLKPKKIKTHFVTLRQANTCPPRALNQYPELVLNFLTGFTRKKEVTDKFIAMLVQKAINDGYTEIYIVSSDYDFIDIFKMAIEINECIEIRLVLIVPDAQGKMKNLKENINNHITVIV
jgi:hypothetical protein